MVIYHAPAILKALLGSRRTYPNMFDAHPPFQINGDFGGAADYGEVVELVVEDARGRYPK